MHKMLLSKLEQEFSNLCAQGKINEALALLEKEDAHNLYFSRCINYAIKEGHIKGVQQVVQSRFQNASQNELNEFLRAAIKEGSIEGVRMALELGADVNHVSTFDTPLSLVCSNYYFDKKAQAEIAKLLINAGADVNSQISYDQQTPLMHAVSDVTPNPQLVRALLEGGADISLTNKDGETALDLVNKDRYGRKGELAQLILESQEGADALDTAYQSETLVAAISSQNMDLARQIIERGGDVNRPDASGITPLMAAVLQKDEKMVALLLENGADVNAKDHEGNSVLLHAFSKLGNNKVIDQFLYGAGCEIDFNDPILPRLIESAQLSAYTPYIHQLVQRAGEEASNPNWMFIKDNKTGLNALTAALKARDYRLVRQILRECPSDWKENKEEIVQLLKAAAENEEGLNVILGAGVDINTQDSNGNTALLLASKEDKGEAVRNLMRYGADDTIKNTQGESVSQIVSSLNHSSARNAYEGFSSQSHFDFALYEKDPQAINKKDRFGKTPLMRAVEMNRIDIVQKLLKYNPDLSLTNHKGQTVLEVCVAKSNPVMMKMLLDYAHQQKKIEGTQGINGEESKDLAALLEAIKTRDEATFNALVQKMNRLDIQNEQGENPLQAACTVVQGFATNPSLKFGAQEKAVLERMVQTLSSKTGNTSGGNKDPLVILAKALRDAKSPEDKKYVEKLMMGLVERQVLNRNSKDDEGVSIFEYALNANSYDLVQKMIDKGLSLNDETKDGVSYRTLLEQKEGRYKDLAQRPSYGANNEWRTPLRTANSKPYDESMRMSVGTGNLDMIASLINEGVYPTKDMIWDVKKMGELAQKGCEEAWRYVNPKGLDKIIEGMQGKTALHFLTEGGYYQETAKLLKHISPDEAKAFLNTPSENGVTPLMSALARGDKKMVDLMLHYGADPSMVDNKGKSVAEYASNPLIGIHFNEQLAKLSQGEPIGLNEPELTYNEGATDTDKFLSYLHEAVKQAKQGNWDESEALAQKAMVLYQNKENINITAVHSKTGKTALMMAVEMQNLELAKELLQDPRITSEALMQRCNGKTALDMAESLDDVQMVDFLSTVYHQKDCHIGDETVPADALQLAHENKTSALLALAQKNRLNIRNTKDRDDRTVLHHLALHNRFDEINSLIRDPKQNITTFDFVASDIYGNSVLDILRINGHEERVNRFVETRFHEEFQKRTADLNIVKELLEHGGGKYINTPDEYGTTPLAYAIKSGNSELVSLILKNAPQGAIVLEDGQQISPEELAKKMLAQAQESGDKTAILQAQKILASVSSSKPQDQMASARGQNASTNDQGALAVLGPHSSARLTDGAIDSPTNSSSHTR